MIQFNHYLRSPTFKELGLSEANVRNKIVVKNIFLKLSSFIS